MIEFSQNCPMDILVHFPDTMDARNINYTDYFDLAVTSPPYANAVDYPRTHQLESYWLDLTSGSLTPLKKKHVGTESVLSTEYKKLHKIGVKEADMKLSRIFKKDPRRSYIAFKYLNDMRLNLLEVHKALKKGGRYIVVVGNNRIRNELFESWKYIMNLAEGIGFKIENYFASEIIRHFIKVPRENMVSLAD
jgi:DNA modification methylase